LFRPFFLENFTLIRHQEKPNLIIDYWRMHKLLSILLLSGLLSSYVTKSSFAQDHYLDSLKREALKAGVADTTLIDNLIKIGDRLGYSDKVAARDYLDRAYTLAKKRSLSLSMGDALSGIAQAHYRTNNLDSCMHYLRLADTLYAFNNTEGAKARQISSKMNMATVLRTQGQASVAITMYLEGIDSLRHIDIPDKSMKLITAYLNIGLVYNELNQYDKALFYHKKGLGLVDKQTTSDIRTYYLRLHRIHDFIELHQYDSAKYYLDKENPLFIKLNQVDINSQLYTNWGMYYLGIKDAAAALTAFEKAYRYAISSKNEFRQEQILARIAKIYREKKQYRESIEYFQKALVLSHAIQDKPSEMHYLKQLASLYTITKSDRLAARHYQQYVQLADSLNATENKRKINEIENKYQFTKKQDSILVLQKDNQLQRLQLHKRHTLNIALIAGCASLLLLIVLTYRNLKHRQRLLKQEKTIHTQKIIELEKDRQLIAVQSVLKGQEEERGRLSRDLHDGVGGLLSGVKLTLSTMKGNVFLSEENAHTVNNVIVQLDQSIAELRRVSHNMMPEALIKYGLKEALENYCEGLNSSGIISVQFQAYGMDQRLEQSTEIVVYRIVQELLSNVIKHAQAKQVLVQLIRNDEHFTLTVEDDGKGFNLEEAEKKDGAGLANIKARTEYLGGTLDIQSNPDEGTSVNVNF